MPSNVPLECACGKLRGTARAVSPSTSTRIICYCDDCQAFARFLGRPGLMDDRGGTQIVAMAPSKVQLTSGTETLGCVRLSDKGMHRWYCTECYTPLGNTSGPSLPYVGVIQSFMALDRDGLSADEVLGPPRARIKTEFATAGSPIPSPPLATLWTIARIVKLLATWWVTGAGSPSPFYDEGTRAPRVTPRILSAEERRQLDGSPAPRAAS